MKPASLCSVIAPAFVLLGFVCPAVQAQFATPISGALSIFSNDVALDAAGDAYVTGSFQGEAQFDGRSTVGHFLTSVGLKDIFVARYDPEGQLVWAIGIGGTGGGPGLDDEGLALALSPNGHLYVTGYFQGTADFDPGPETAALTSAGFRDVFLASYTRDGTFRWARSFGGTADDRGYGVAAPSDERVYITGAFQEKGVFGPGGDPAFELNSQGMEDGFVARFSSEGGLEQAVRFGGGFVDEGRDLGIDEAGNLYLLGHFSGEVDFDPGPEEQVIASANDSQDVVLASYTAEGAYRWAFRIGGPQIDGGNGLAVDADGNSVVVGHFVGKSDFDPGPETAERVSLGARDLYLVRYDARGNYEWVIKGGTGYAEASDVAISPEGYLVVTGVFSGDLFPDPFSTIKLTSQSEQDILLASYSETGQFRWASAIGGPLADAGEGVAVEGDGSVWLTGYFEDGIDFDPGAGRLDAFSEGIYDGFLARYDDRGQLAVGIDPQPEPAFSQVNLDVFPNPAHERAQVILAVQQPDLVRLEVVDVLGRPVRIIDEIDGLTDSELTISLDLSDLSSGLYLVRATSQSGVQVHSFAITR